MMPFLTVSRRIGQIYPVPIRKEEKMLTFAQQRESCYKEQTRWYGKQGDNLYLVFKLKLIFPLYVQMAESTSGL